MPQGSSAVNAALSIQSSAAVPMTWLRKRAACKTASHKAEPADGLSATAAGFFYAIIRIA